jgi:Uma2 family endonuclease
MATVVEPTVDRMDIRPLSIEEFHWLIENGFFHEDERVELIEGVLHKMSPKGRRHAACLTRAIRLFNAALADRACVRAQDPITLTDSNSEPEPDLVVARAREDDYVGRHPHPEDIVVVVEIADSSLAYDRRIKVPLYAAAGILEYWIVNLRDDLIEVYRDPTSPEERAPYYHQHLTFSANDTLHPVRFPDCVLAVADLLPPKRD